MNKQNKAEEIKDKVEQVVKPKRQVVIETDGSTINVIKSEVTPLEFEMIIMKIVEKLRKGK